MDKQVPYIPQEEGSPTCSVAAMRMAFQKFGYDRRDEDIMAELPNMDELKQKGLHNDAFDSHLKKYFKCDVKDGSELDEILRALEEGKVVIVNFVLGEEPIIENGRYSRINGVITDGHYGVVIKIEGNDIEIHDPEFGPNLRMDIADFERRWQAFYSSHRRWVAIIAGVREEVKADLINISF